jgi:putative MATE family efflux protein
MQRFDEQLVSGNVPRSVWKLSWPFVGAQVVRGLNLFVAQSLIGNHVGHRGNAAVGVGWQFFLLTFVLYIALLQGMAILIARYTGRQDSDALSRLVFETFKASFLFVGFFLMPVGFFAAPWALDMMNTAPDVQEHALPFLRIVFVGGAPLLLLFLLNRAFQATGDVRMPLILGAISTAVNICVNIFLIVVLDMGVEGAAWGFVCGPVPSLCLALYFIYSKRMVIRPPKKHTLGLDFNVLKSVIRIGLPTGITSFLATLAGVIILSILGSLEESAAAQAAYSLCYTLLFAFFTWVGLSLSAASNTLIGQNIGAGKVERGIHCVNVAARAGGIWSVGLGLVFWFFPTQLLSLFGMEDAAALEISVGFLRFLAFAGFFTVTSQTFFGGLMGAGDTKSPMFITTTTQIGILFGYCYIVSRIGTVTATTVWTGILIAAACRFVLAIGVFKRGRWVHIKVELDEKPVTPVN